MSVPKTQGGQAADTVPDPVDTDFFLIVACSS
jgi:hypothetical protein